MEVDNVLTNGAVLSGHSELTARNLERKVRRRSAHFVRIRCARGGLGRSPQQEPVCRASCSRASRTPTAAREGFSVLRPVLAGGPALLFLLGLVVTQQLDEFRWQADVAAVGA